jgi:cell division protein FtsA
VDIGGGTTDMAVFYDGVLKHTAVIPYAGVNITNDIRNGLGVLRAQAEQMKVQFGTALADEANANAYITIPGLRGLPPKEISVKNLANIIQARMQEILDYVVYHLKQIGLDKKLYGGVILTGGGAQLKHIIQLTEYVTGLGARIGYPNEHLSGNDSETMMNPMYSTCIGLILRGYHDYENGRLRFVGEGGNIMHISAEEAKVIADNLKTVEDSVADDGEAEGKENRHAKRSENFKKLFDGFKGKFMKLFEEVDDQEME